MEKMVGIVSGMGPSAGLDLARKVVDQTTARRDQQHLPMTLVSVPGRIGNRTDFILGYERTNPAEGIIHALDKLHLAGATVVGIPCNTSHAECIFGVVRDHVKTLQPPVTLLNMVDEVCAHISAYYPGVTRVGLLSTSGTAAAGVYAKGLEAVQRRAVELDSELQAQLNDAIHDEDFGIKAFPGPATSRAVRILERCLASLTEQGAQIAVLACTELPLAIAGVSNPGLALLDSNLVLARSLVRAINPGQLKAWVPDELPLGNPLGAALANESGASETYTTQKAIS